MLRRFLQDERGQIAEIIMYVALAIIVIGLVGVLSTLLRNQVNDFLTAAGNFFTELYRRFAPW